MISEKISLLKLRIAATCQRTGRSVEDICVVAVSKLAGIEDIKQTLEAGINDVGENKVQDALLKFNAMANSQYAKRTKWHMVGHLQTNKVKEAVKIFDLIHSVDSQRVAVEIDKQAAKINKVQDILIEVNISQENSKFGIKAQDALGFLKDCASLKNINIKGLMTIAPLTANPADTRQFFRQLKQLRDKLNELQVTGYQLRELSMGMTDDFQLAIEEGSTIVRIGRAIFEG